MARPLGACFHLTHGVSIALLLAVVTEFSLTGASDRYQQIAAAMGAPELVTALRELVRDVRIPSLPALHVPADRYESLVPKMAADALESGSPANNPRLATAEEIVALYRRAYAEND
jgi:alcohol dehydrogenase class IV